MAQDARVSRSVMVRHYVDENDERLRQASNRTFERLVAGLNPEVAKRYGYEIDPKATELEERLRAAMDAKDWKLVEEVSRQLRGEK